MAIMTTFRCQVVIPMFSNLPEDVITNTFHFEDITPGITTAAVATAITPLLSDFYDFVYGGTFMANWTDPSLCVARWYNLSDPIPRPVTIVPMPIAGVQVASTLPTEVAVVLSFQGIQQAGVPQARRRGRIYLGGLSHNIISSSAVDRFPQVIASFVTNVCNGADALRTAVVSSTRFWAILSTTSGDVVEVNNGWVDNSPDTQRRRSVDATSRTLWS